MNDQQTAYAQNRTVTLSLADFIELWRAARGVTPGFRPTQLEMTNALDVTQKTRIHYDTETANLDRIPKIQPGAKMTWWTGEPITIDQVWEDARFGVVFTGTLGSGIFVQGFPNDLKE